MSDTSWLVSSGFGFALLDYAEVVELKSGKIFSMAPLGRGTTAATGGLLDGPKTLQHQPFVGDQIK